MLNIYEVLSFIENGSMHEDLPLAESPLIILSKCTQNNDPSDVLHLYKHLCKWGIETKSSFGSELVLMFLNVQSMQHAKRVFDKLECPDKSTWNAVIAAYVQYRGPKAAMDLYNGWEDVTLHAKKLTLLALIDAFRNSNEETSLHDHIQRTGTLEEDLFLARYLVDMYIKSEHLTKALEILDGWSIQEVGLWNSLIACYAELELDDDTFEAFERMKVNGVTPNNNTYTSVLKACRGRLSYVEKIHIEIARNRLTITDLTISDALICAYSRCGLIAKAEEVFTNLRIRNLGSWNSIMTAYSQHQYGDKVLHCLKTMESEGISPDAYSLCCSLKACRIIGAADEGRRLHASLEKLNFLKGDIVLGNALIDMYTQLGLMEEAQHVFDKLPEHDRISWNSLMTGYVNIEFGEKALECYRDMKIQGINPDTVSFLCGLKACICSSLSEKGQEIHAEIIKWGLERGLLLGSKLVDMYANCGLTKRSEEVFDMLEVRDVVSWNALISGYCNHECGEKALVYIEKMKMEGFSPNVVTYICGFKACANMGALDVGEKFHDEIARRGLLEKHPAVGNALIDMYSKCNSLKKAQEVLLKLQNRDIVSWNALITGFVQHGCGKEALSCFEKLRQEGLLPDGTTYACALKACGMVAMVEIGKKIHNEVVTRGLLRKDLHISSSLVDMYAKCGMLAKAQEVFDELAVHDLVSWNALISGYSQYECGKEALRCFEQMQQEGFVPDIITYVSILKACGSLQAIHWGEKIEAQICKAGVPDGDLVITNALVDMYSKCGYLARARKALNKLLVCDVYTWNALIVGYVNHEDGEEALICSEIMDREGILPDEITHIYILKACSLIGAIDKGEEIYKRMCKGSLELNINVGIAMLDMYAKNGLVAKAKDIFYKLPLKEIVAWNALITAYALLGKTKQVSFSFAQMMRNGNRPNKVTFASVLSSYNHEGQVNEGKSQFEAMTTMYGIIPEVEHYTCMIDLLSRAGQLEEAVVVANQMPFQSNLFVWHTLLSSARQWGNIDLGIYAFDNVLKLDVEDVSALTCMAYIYSDVTSIEDT
ncbi:hypothetical protein KP509_11G085300 [Ceratopteris richardii]|nr:hypothetical protein KP509_11G085300 [Ceratopteris richardii]